MSLWKRFVRAIKALFGGAVSAIENPRLILEENIRELNDQVPKLNENIATVKANVILLEKEYNRYKQEYEALMAKIKAAIKNGRDDIAANYAIRLESLKKSMADTQQELELAKKAYEKALEIKKAFMRERERKIKEAQEALRAHERAKWQRKIADVFQQFEVGGIAQTHEEMIARLNEETAKSEAMLEMALDSVDTQSIKLEEEAEKIQAMELVKQLKEEMGLLEVPQSTPTREEGSQSASQEREIDL
jgi:phage shock protein A